MTIAGKNITRTIDVGNIDQRVLFGQNGLHIRLIESQFDIKIVARGDTITVEGDRSEVDNVVRLFEDLMTRTSMGHELSERYLFYAIDMVKEEGHGPAEHWQKGPTLSA